MILKYLQKCWTGKNSSVSNGTIKCYIWREQLCICKFLYILISNLALMFNLPTVFYNLTVQVVKIAFDMPNMSRSIWKDSLLHKPKTILILSLTKTILKFEKIKQIKMRFVFNVCELNNVWNWVWAICDFNNHIIGEDMEKRYSKGHIQVWSYTLP